MSRIIITGGTGFIGRHLAADLAGAGHEVVVLTRHPNSDPDLPSDVRLVGWDTQSAAGWGHLADGAGAIVNLAGETIAPARWTEERKQRIVSSRVNAGRAVVEAIQGASQKPRVLIQSSAVGYYGPHGDEIITEESPPGNDFQAEVCNQWEASTAEVETLGVRRAVIRTGIVQGRGSGTLPLISLPFRFFAGGRVGSGRQWLPWIHMADEVGAIRFLIENEAANGPFNLAAPNPATNAEFSQALGRAMGRPSLLPVPAFALKLVFGQMSEVLLEGARVVPKRLQGMGYPFRFPELEPALRDLMKDYPLRVSEITSAVRQFLG